MKKDFNVENFAKGYISKLNNEDKKKYLKTELKTINYLPYGDKTAIAENIVKSSSYAIVKKENTNELIRTNKIKINSPMRYILFVMTVINKYTNIEVNFSNVMPEFDYLNENGLIEEVFKRIGEREIGELQTVIEMVMDDFMTNEYEFKNFITDKLYMLNDVVQKFIPVITNIADKIENLPDEDMEKISGRINKLITLIKK